MFGHDHRAEEIDERIDHLMAAVFVADDTDRLERLTRHLSFDFVYVSPEAVFEGAAGLSEAFARFRREPRWHAEGSISRVVTFEGLVPGPPGGRS